MCLAVTYISEIVIKFYKIAGFAQWKLKDCYNINIYNKSNNFNKLHTNLLAATTDLLSLVLS